MCQVLSQEIRVRTRAWWGIYVVEWESSFARNRKGLQRKCVDYLDSFVPRNVFRRESIEAIADEEDAVYECAIRGTIDREVLKERVCAEEFEGLVQDISRFRVLGRK